jgi:hypothetical protein
MKHQTPWGIADSTYEIADGILSHHTASHGGIELSPERHAALQSKFRFHTFAGGRWYEEDCDACAVVIAFPDAFPAHKVPLAIQAAKAFLSWEQRDYTSEGKWARVLKHCRTNHFLRDHVTEVAPA